MKTIEQTRRELFEARMMHLLCSEGYSSDSAHCVMERESTGRYSSIRVAGAWQGFNAALDAVVIELPVAFPEYSSPEPGWDKGYEDGYNYMHNEACTAIESTNLGLKVK